jgi:hypothetical protein
VYLKVEISNTIGRGYFLFLTFLCLPLVFSSIVGAQQSPGDEQRMIQKIKDEILKELRDGGLLQQEIELGIQRFVEKQRESELAGRAEQDRLANEQVKKYAAYPVRVTIFMAIPPHSYPSSCTRTMNARFVKRSIKHRRTS